MLLPGGGGALELEERERPNPVAERARVVAAVVAFAAGLATAFTFVVMTSSARTSPRYKPKPLQYWPLAFVAAAALAVASALAPRYRLAMLYGAAWWTGAWMALAGALSIAEDSTGWAQTAAGAALAATGTLYWTRWRKTW